jgi:putative transposase
MRFAPDEFYHIVNRGVDGKTVFPQKSDYERFLKGLKEFNSPHPKELRFTRSEVVSPRLRKNKQEKLVDVACYCLMKNHIHVLIRVISPEKAAQFLQKLFIGYTMYFNTKYQRKGVLFQGRTKARHVNEGVYLDHILRYIHLNPLDYIDKKWREHGIANIRSARRAVLKYPWSSICGCIGDEQNPIINNMLAREIVSSKQDFLDSLLSWSSEDYLLGDRISEDWE